MDSEYFDRNLAEIARNIGVRVHEVEEMFKRVRERVEKDRLVSEYVEDKLGR